MNLPHDFDKVLAESWIEDTVDDHVGWRIDDEEQMTVVVEVGCSMMTWFEMKGKWYYCSNRIMYSESFEIADLLHNCMMHIYIWIVWHDVVYCYACKTWNSLICHISKQIYKMSFV